MERQKHRDERILIVEDDPLFRMYMRTVLENIGYKVDQAGRADQALRLVSKTSYNLVISDVNMPGKSGKDLLSEIKTHYASIPVIMVSGLSQIEAAVECMKIGAFDFVSKPFDLEKFISLVNKAIQLHIETEEDGTKTLPPQAARTINGYTIISTLGEGNMGIVFLVEKEDQNLIKKKYALKIVKASLSEEQNQRLLARFFNEIDIVSKLHHKNIVTVYEHGYSEELRIPYYVMEYIDGKSLKAYITGGITSFSLVKKVRILQQIASALSVAHEEGIYHRDIKPDNILITKDHNAKLTDFGIAKLPGSEITHTDHTVGTPAYLSPEGFNSCNVDHRSDIFSLGAVSYEFLLGKRAFPGENVIILAYEVYETHPLEPRKIEPDFPILLQNILAKMLKKKPEERYQKTEQLVQDFDRYMKNDPQSTVILTSSAETNWS